MNEATLASWVIALALLAWAVFAQIALGRAKRATQKAEQEHAQKLSRFSPILDADAEASRLIADAQREATAARTAANAESSAAQRDAASIRQETEKLQTAYKDKKQIYDRLSAEVAIFDERLAFAEMGVYEPHFDFGDSEQFKAAILAVREEQKKMISAKTAVFCTTDWQVDGSRAKGQTMINRNVRLTLRAFNGEADAAIANARWNNALAMEKRIMRAFEQISKHNASNAIHISEHYRQLKINELRLAHEQRERQKIEKDDRAEAMRLAREEQRLIKDLEEAQAQEEHYQRLLAKAKAEADSIVGPKLYAFNEQIKILEKDLAEAHAKAERAKAMAEQTRSGYVYIISNVGSFGEGVVKIGLTRRLDPMDRVRELGDASVPFTFDIHAIIYSDDAPALERALHVEFDSVRINAQNYRKEFFRAPLEEVEAAIKRLAPSAPFFRDVEAQEYRETLSRRKQALEISQAAERETFPDMV
jgi:hypothetical protein